MVVLELLRWRAPAALILAVVLLSFNTRVPHDLGLGFIEFFAGDGNISLALWSCGVRGSSHDIRYSALMDLCTPSGFANFGCSYIVCELTLYRVCFYSVYLKPEARNQRSVEHKSWGLCAVWYMLQQLLQDVSWLNMQYIYKYICSIHGIIWVHVHVFNLCPCKVLSHCRAGCVERLSWQWGVLFCPSGQHAVR